MTSPLPLAANAAFPPPLSRGRGEGVTAPLPTDKGPLHGNWR
jgi:hypothetical protein